MKTFSAISRGCGVLKRQQRDWKVTALRTSLTAFFHRIVFPYVSVYAMGLGATGTRLGIINSVGMDLGEVKKNYGHMVCPIGNVDCGYTLSSGTLEEVREDVKRCMRQAARGGGYICMSSTIHPGVKPENYVEMVRAIHDYGKYPISI